MRLNKTNRLLLAAVAGLAVFAAVFIASRIPGENLLGRILKGDELLRVQVESDFDRDGDVDFLDFTVFSAFYEEV